MLLNLTHISKVKQQRRRRQHHAEVQPPRRRSRTVASLTIIHVLLTGTSTHAQIIGSQQQKRRRHRTEILSISSTLSATASRDPLLLQGRFMSPAGSPLQTINRVRFVLFPVSPAHYRKQGPSPLRHIEPAPTESKQPQPAEMYDMCMCMYGLLGLCISGASTSPTSDLSRKGRASRRSYMYCHSARRDLSLLLP